MTRSIGVTIATYFVLGLAGVVGISMPRHLDAVPSSDVGAYLDRVVLCGIARDFSAAHADFSPPAGPALVAAGAVVERLGPGARPVLREGGYGVLTPWRDERGHFIAPHLAGAAEGDSGRLDRCGRPHVDRAGETGEISCGLVTDPSTFDEWFRDVPDVNLSVMHPIALENIGDGVYDYTTNAFYPVDAMLLGNEVEAHNRRFTYTLTAPFTYEACAGQFIAFRGGDGAWLFIDGRLVVDLGGTGAPYGHYVDLDRLGLDDGATCEMRLYYANRASVLPVFSMRTNVFRGDGAIEHGGAR
jgi:fibro-slime domain-containing protein